MHAPSNLAETRDLLHRELIRTDVVTSCLNCECFDKKTEQCLEFNQRPPAEVIVFGCPEWIQAIPF